MKFELMFGSDGELSAHFLEPVSSLTENDIAELYSAIRTTERHEVKPRKFHALWRDDESWHVVGGPYRESVKARTRAALVARETPNIERRVAIAEYGYIVAEGNYRPGSSTIRFRPVDGEIVDLRSSARHREHALSD